MKTSASSRRAFTLIELLVVIAVIGILAAMILPITGALTRRKKIAVAQTQLSQIETAIESYKSKLGFYPPDRPTNPTKNPAINPLFLELVGTLATNDSGTLYYVPRDGSARVSATDVNTAFGVTGVMNSSQSASGGDEAVAATTFINQLRPDQKAQISANGVTVPILVCSVSWNSGAGELIASPNQPGLNPWQYNSSNPTNNPSSFDLWVDVFVGGKTNRISNWSKTPQIVP